MITRSPLHSLFIALLAVTVTAASTARSQNLFAPAIKVNDKVITQYDLNQRSLMLTMFRSPGDPAKEARSQLIEERLKLDAAQALDVLPANEEISRGIEDFAARANMTADEFLAALKQGGIEEQTFRDFIVSGVAWRSLVRARFGAKVEVGDSDIDQALNATSTDSIRVLLSEIILPAPPAEAAAAQARANELSQITTESAFAAAARKYSATATSARGGRLEWMPLSNLPATLHPVLLGLGRGQVSDPIPIDGAIALFQLRGIDEGKVATPRFSAIDYAAYFIAGGRSPEALATARKLTQTVDTCDDLYGVAKGQPEEVLERSSKAPADLPTDFAVELAKLDKHEVSTALTRGDGQTLVFLMLCGRTPEQAEGVDRDQIGSSLQNRRLASYADGYLAQLRSEARIIEY